MESYYQLFDVESGNLIAEFAHEQEIWEALRPLERDELFRLGLVRMEDEEVTLVAMDDDLVRRIHANVVPFAAPEPIRQKAQ